MYDNQEINKIKTARGKKNKSIYEKEYDDIAKNPLERQQKDTEDF